MFSMVALPGFSQSNGLPEIPPKENHITKTEYTRLDKISRSYNDWLFGTGSRDVDFILVEIKNLSTNERILGVEISISRKDTEVIGRSVGFANLGSLWGVDTETTVRNLTSQGYIFLLQEDLEEIINFLDEVIGATGREQENYKLYSLSLYDRFELGVLYDRAWYFTVNVDDASYRLDYQPGLEMLMKLNSFKKYIDENS